MDAQVLSISHGVAY